MTIKSAFLSLISTIVLFLIFTTNAYSADFSTSFEAIYTLTKSSETKVKQTVKTTNLTAESYVTSFTINLGNQKIKDLKASDKNGALQVKYTQNASDSAILVNFSDKVVGKDISRTFTVEYISESISEKQGNIYSVSIPKITGDAVQDYNITIIAPNEIGAPSMINPQPTLVQKKTDSTHYSFNKKQLVKSGISFYIGQKQVYNVALSYHLKNPQNQKVYTEIALPMSTAFQTVVFESITPQPESIKVDVDGNYIAKYFLDPKQELDVEFSGQAIINLNKSDEFKEEISEDQKKLYTRPQKYWEVDDPEIASLAASLKTPENIYQFVSNKLSYNSSRLQADQYSRKGALGALQKPDDSVCMEFTDLFIAIARAAGIPAREVNGYGYSFDKSSRPLSLSQDVLHAWPEYWDDQRGWVAVDPTWGNTTGGIDFFNSFDLNHIAFVRKGASSETPYPAGSYKSKDSTTRDVIINFTENQPEIKTDLELINRSTQSVLAGTEIQIPLEFKNSGNVVYQKEITANLTYNNKKYDFKKLLIIPPGATYKWQLAGISTNYSDNETTSVQFQTDKLNLPINVQVIPFYFHPYFFITAVYLIGIPLSCFVLYRLLHKRDVKKRMIK